MGPPTRLACIVGHFLTTMRAQQVCSRPRQSMAAIVHPRTMSSMSPGSHMLLSCSGIRICNIVRVYWSLRVCTESFTSEQGSNTVMLCWLDTQSLHFFLAICIIKLQLLLLCFLGQVGLSGPLSHVAAPASLPPPTHLIHTTTGPSKSEELLCASQQEYPRNASSTLGMQTPEFVDRMSTSFLLCG